MAARTSRTKMTIWRVLSKLLLQAVMLRAAYRIHRHRVVAPSAHRTASQKTTQGKVKTAAQAMGGQGLMSVLGAGRLEAAGGSRDRHQQRRDCPAIGRERAE